MANYISKIQLPSNGTYELKDSLAVHIGDYEPTDGWKKGTILYSGTTENTITQLVPVGNETGMVLALSNGVPVWASASTQAGVNNANLKFKLNNGTEFTIFKANENTDQTIEFKTGETGDGSFIIKYGNTSTEIPIYFQNDSAAKVTVTSLNTTAQGYANTAEQNAKDYADGLITGLGTILEFKGIDTEVNIKALTSAKAGDVWITSTGTEWVCKESIITGVANADAWEPLGPVIDLSIYEQTSNLGILAYKDGISVTGKYYKADATSGSTSITPSGTISSAAPSGSQNANYTPAGSVTISNIDLNLTKVNSKISKYINGDITAPSIESNADSTWAFTIEDNETLKITGTNSSVNSKFKAGSIPLSDNTTFVTGSGTSSATGTFSGTGTYLSFSGQAASHTHGITSTKTDVEDISVTYANKGTASN